MARLDSAAFDRLVRQHHAAVYRSALRVVRNERDAEDVAQDVFLRALGGKVPLHAEEPRAALCWLATRLGLNLLRGDRRRQHKENEATMQQALISPAQQAGEAELHGTVRTLVRDLPDDLRLPLLLRYQDELTFRSVGTALAISESTAHERVQQAIERLRRLLSGMGFALAPVRLPELVAAPQPASVPAGLESRLLGLADATPVAAVTAKAAVAAVLLAGAAAVVWAVASPRDPVKGDHAVAANGPLAARVTPELPTDTTSALRTLLPTDAPQQPPPPPVQDPAPTHATFTGTVHDALNWPVNGASIQAVAAGGLKPFELAKTTADNTGAFSLAVPFAGEPVPASRIRIQVLEQSVLLMQTDELALTAEVASKPLRLVLPASAGSATTRFELVCTVRSAAGAPLCGVPVQIFSRTSEGEPRPGWNRPDSEVLTGADGVARLTGRTQGSKVLFADGRKQGLRTAQATVDIARPGEHQTAFTLLAGKTLQARITTVDDKLLEWGNVWLEEEDTRITHTGKLGNDGSVEFPCLGDGPFTLRVTAHPHSPVALRGLRPGEPVAVKMKLSSDVRDHGNHMAEVHGRLVDAGGEVVAFSPFDLEVLRARPRDGDSTLPLDMVEPPGPAQRASDGKMRQAFHGTGLEAGRWAVVARVKGYAVAVEFVELREGELRAGVELRLLRGATVTGRVVDHQGQPVAKALVFVTGFGPQADAGLAARDDPKEGAERRRWVSLLPCSARTDGTGAFTLGPVPPGHSLRVVVEADGFHRTESTAIELPAGGAREGLELRLRAR